MKRLTTALILAAATTSAQATPSCFRLTPQALNLGPWGSRYVVFEIPDTAPRVLAGRAVYHLYGIGWNEAPSKFGGTDTSGLTATAYRLPNGGWNVDFVATLWQGSQLPPVNDHMQYFLAATWKLDAALNGLGAWTEIGRYSMPDNPNLMIPDAHMFDTIEHISCEGLKVPE